MEEEEVSVKSFGFHLYYVLSPDVFSVEKKRRREKGEKRRGRRKE